MIPNEKSPCLKCNLCESNGLYLFCKAFPDGIVNVYAINYNILKIQNGMAGIMFSS